MRRNRLGAAETLGPFTRPAWPALRSAVQGALDGQRLKLSVLGLSDITASLEARVPDVFEARGVPSLDGLLVAFKRDDNGRISGLAISPDSLHELPFRKVPSN